MSLLGTMMVRAGLLSDEQLAAIQASSAERKLSFVEALLAHGFADEDSVVGFLHSKLMIPKVGSSVLDSVDRGALDRIPGEIAARHVVLPISSDETGNLTLAMVDPTDMKAVDAISAHTGAYLVRAVAPLRVIRSAIARHYGIEAPALPALKAGSAPATTRAPAAIIPAPVAPVPSASSPTVVAVPAVSAPVIAAPAVSAPTVPAVSAPTIVAPAGVVAPPVAAPIRPAIRPAAVLQPSAVVMSGVPRPAAVLPAGSFAPSPYGIAVQPPAPVVAPPIVAPPIVAPPELGAPAAGLHAPSAPSGDAVRPPSAPVPVAAPRPPSAPVPAASSAPAASAPVPSASFTPADSAPVLSASFTPADSAPVPSASFTPAASAPVPSASFIPAVSAPVPSASFTPAPAEPDPALAGGVTEPIIASGLSAPASSAELTGPVDYAAASSTPPIANLANMATLRAVDVIDPDARGDAEESGDTLTGGSRSPDVVDIPLDDLETNDRGTTLIPGESTSPHFDSAKTGTWQPPTFSAANEIVPLSPEAFHRLLPRFATVTTRDEVTDLLLDFLAEGFSRVIMFVHVKGEIRGRDARGEDLLVEAVRQIRIPAGGPSVFSGAIERRSPYFGSMRTDTPIDAAFFSALGGVEGVILVLPVILRDKVPLVVFASGSSNPVDPRSLHDLTHEVAASLERIIVSEKARPR